MRHHQSSRLSTIINTPFAAKKQKFARQPTPSNLAARQKEMKINQRAGIQPHRPSTAHQQKKKNPAQQSKTNTHAASPASNCRIRLLNRNNTYLHTHTRTPTHTRRPPNTQPSLQGVHGLSCTDLTTTPPSRQKQQKLSRYPAPSNLPTRLWLPRQKKKRRCKTTHARKHTATPYKHLPRSPYTTTFPRQGHAAASSSDPSACILGPVLLAHKHKKKEISTPIRQNTIHAASPIFKIINNNQYPFRGQKTKICSPTYSVKPSSSPKRNENQPARRHTTASSKHRAPTKKKKSSPTIQNKHTCGITSFELPHTAPEPQQYIPTHAHPDAHTHTQTAKHAAFPTGRPWPQLHRSHNNTPLAAKTTKT